MCGRESLRLAQIPPCLPPQVLPKGRAPAPLYNYSVGAFRKWWVGCAVEAVRGSGGLLDGLFLDGTPKLHAQHGAMEHWGSMVDELRASLGASALLIDNGFYINPAGDLLAGEGAGLGAGHRQSKAEGRGTGGFRWPCYYR